MTSSHEICACLYVKEFPAQALLRLRPELRNKPCVVMEGKPPLQHACSLTRKARSLGLTQGMTRVEVDTFSGVTVLQRSLKEETVAGAVLLECSGYYSPRIEKCNDDRSFLCVLDIAGTTRLFGPPETLAPDLLARTSTLGISACIAVSSNFYAAVTLAKGSLPLSVGVIPEGEESAALAALPLTVLDLTEEQAKIFSLWGIGTLGMLAALPEKELISRMGQAGKRLRQMARGEAPHLFQPVESAFTLHEHMELDSPVEVLDALMFVTNLMLEQLILRATTRVLSLASVCITLTLEGGTVYTRTVRPALPTNDRQLWLKLLHLDLEAHPPQAAILAIELNAEPGSTHREQFGLFSPQLPDPSRLDVTLARLRAIVGEENVGQPVLDDTHAPEAFHMEPFKVPSNRTGEPEPTRSCIAQRRIRPAETISMTLSRNRPTAFFFRQIFYRVDRAYGPWVTSGEWWKTTLWGDEQWDVVARTESGQMLSCCIVRDVMRDQWQMVALYD